MDPDEYQAAKWLKVPVLAEPEEFARLFEKLKNFQLFHLGTPAEIEALRIEKEAFLASVGNWTAMLQTGRAPAMADCRSVLAAALTSDPGDLRMQALPDGRYLAKIKRPVIQVQAHFFTVSLEEKRVHSMVFGKESIFWGVQFSYPQIFMDAGEPKKVDASFANTALFQEIRRWARDETRATPFLIGDERVNAPIRLGKNCFSWICRHPQLLQCKLGVVHAH